MSTPVFEQYVRPNVAVDLVILTLVAGESRDTPDQLGVVIRRRADTVPVLPGRFIRERDTVARTVAVAMEDKLGLRPRETMSLEAIGVYDDPERDPRGWSLSLAYACSLRPDERARLLRSDTEILPVTGEARRGQRVTPEPLGYDHDQMVTTAVRRLRRRYERSPDPLHLVRSPWTLSQLRHVHEAVLDDGLKRDTFNRRMRPYVEEALDGRGDQMFTSATVGRPAQLFRRAGSSRKDPEAGPFPLPRRQERTPT